MKEIKQMGFTHADFFRLLPRAMGDNKYSVTGDTVQAVLATGTVTISIGEEKQRKLSPHVIMPYTDVTFEYANVPDELRFAFEEYFHLRFMKGLG